MDYSPFSQIAKDRGLLAAAQNNDTQEIQNWILQGANPNAVDEDNNAALLWAAHHGNDKATTLLLDANANVNQQGALGFTPLMSAAENKHFSTIKLLLGANANPNICDENGHIPLVGATRSGNAEIAALLFPTDAGKSLQGEGGNLSLLYSAKTGLTGMVSLLLQAGVKINPREHVYGNTPLHLAAQNGHIKIVKLLLQVGAIEALQNNPDDSPFHFIVEDTGRIVREEGPLKNPIHNTFGQTPLHLAIQGGHIGIIKLLLNAGVDVNLLDVNGYTPLHVATAKDYVGIAALLLQAGANKNLQNTNGIQKIPMQLAKNAEMVFCFLNFMSTEEINAAIPLMPGLDRGVIEFQKQLSACLRNLYARFGSCALTTDKFYYPQEQPLELLAKQLSLCFPRWYRHRILSDLQAIFQIPSKLKEKEEAQNADALLSQSVYTPSLSNGLKEMDLEQAPSFPIAKEHKRKKEGNDDNHKPKRRKLNNTFES